jgi:hypothetical protein
MEGKSVLNIKHVIQFSSLHIVARRLVAKQRDREISSYTTADAK